MPLWSSSTLGRKTIEINCSLSSRFSLTWASRGLSDERKIDFQLGIQRIRTCSEACLLCSQCSRWSKWDSTGDFFLWCRIFSRDLARSGELYLIVWIRHAVDSLSLDYLWLWTFLLWTLFEWILCALRTPWLKLNTLESLILQSFPI